MIGLRLMIIRRAAGAARWAVTLALCGLPHSPAAWAFAASLLALALACKSRRRTRQAPDPHSPCPGCRRGRRWPLRTSSIQQRPTLRPACLPPVGLRAHWRPQ